MEEEIRTSTDNGAVVYARLREVPGAPIVVISHGMTGHMNGRLELGFARRLERNGYSSLRYNSYDWADDARNLCEMGLQEHLADLGAVIAWAREQGPSVVALGHSFGATCIVLRGAESIAAGILWDPAPQKDWAEMNRNIATFDAERRQYVQRERVAVIFSERMLQEVEQADAASAAKGFNAPLLVISSPEWPHINRAGQEYAEQAPHSTRIEIAGADHNFTDDRFGDGVVRHNSLVVDRDSACYQLINSPIRCASPDVLLRDCAQMGQAFRVGISGPAIRRRPPSAYGALLASSATAFNSSRATKRNCDREPTSSSVMTPSRSI